MTTKCPKKTKFISLKKNDGRVTFGDNGISKIIGKDTLNLEYRSTKA